MNTNAENADEKRETFIRFDYDEWGFTIEVYERGEIVATEKRGNSQLLGLDRVVSLSHQMCDTVTTIRAAAHYIIGKLMIKHLVDDVKREHFRPANC